MNFTVMELLRHRWPKGAPMWEHMLSQVKELKEQHGAEFLSWVCLSRPEADMAVKQGMKVIWLHSSRGVQVQALGSPETKAAVTVLCELECEGRDE